MNRFTTTRLLVRPLQLTDSSTVFEYRSDPEVMRYQMWKPADEREVRNFIREQRGLTPGLPGIWYQFGIVELNSGTLVGDCGVHAPIKRSDSIEVGLTLRVEAQGKGYATEALGSLIRFCFKTLHVGRVLARTHPENARSLGLIARCGFPSRPTGRAKDELRYELDHKTWSERYGR
jgi:RimJ/RimL family protein N-acetyltransferase